MTVIKLPYSVTRRWQARRPRRSKNGTPEERAAAQPTVVSGAPAKPRRSKNGTPEVRAARRVAPSATVLTLDKVRAESAPSTSVALPANPTGSAA
jgi:hypothetical protein